MIVVTWLLQNNEAPGEIFSSQRNQRKHTETCNIACALSFFCLIYFLKLLSFSFRFQDSRISDIHIFSVNIMTPNLCLASPSTMITPYHQSRSQAYKTILYSWSFMVQLLVPMLTKLHSGSLS